MSHKKNTQVKSEEREKRERREGEERVNQSCSCSCFFALYEASDLVPTKVLSTSCIQTVIPNKVGIRHQPNKCKKKKYDTNTTN